MNRSSDTGLDHAALPVHVERYLPRADTDSPDCIFLSVQIPKCASTSITRMLDHAFARRRVFYLPHTLDLDGAVSRTQTLRFRRTQARNLFSRYGTFSLKRACETISRTARPGDLIGAMSFSQSAAQGCVAHRNHTQCKRCCMRSGMLLLGLAVTVSRCNVQRGVAGKRERRLFGLWRGRFGLRLVAVGTAKGPRRRNAVRARLGANGVGAGLPDRLQPAPSGRTGRCAAAERRDDRLSARRLLRRASSRAALCGDVRGRSRRRAAIHRGAPHSSGMTRASLGRANLGLADTGRTRTGKSGGGAPIAGARRPPQGEEAANRGDDAEQEQSTPVGGRTRFK